MLCAVRSLVDTPSTHSDQNMLALLHVDLLAWSRPRRRRGRGPLGLVVELLSTRNVWNIFKLLPWCCIRWSHTLMFSMFTHHSSLLTVCLLPPCSDTLSTHQWHHEVFPMSNLSALPVPLANQVPRPFSSQFFTSCFSLTVFRVFGGSLGAFGVVLGSFCGPFWCHFGDF